MATDITVTGKKKLKTIKKEFNEKFPYIRLGIYPTSEKDKPQKAPFDPEKTIVEVRTKANPGEISIHGRTKVKNLENEFEKIFGLYVQVAFTTKENKRYFTSGDLDELSLTAINALGEKEGWKKGDWE